MIVLDVTGSICEGTWVGTEGGMLPKCLVKACRQVNVQDGNVFPLTCEWWDVGDQVYNEHHIVKVAPTNLAPREATHPGRASR